MILPTFFVSALFASFKSCSVWEYSVFEISILLFAYVLLLKLLSKLKFDKTDHYPWHNLQLSIMTIYSVNTSSLYIMVPSNLTSFYTIRILLPRSQFASIIAITSFRQQTSVDIWYNQMDTILIAGSRQIKNNINRLCCQILWW